MKAPLTKNSFVDSRGFSVFELLIVVAMVSIVTGFALIQVVRARQNMARANAAQLLAAHLEKARLDSVRRRPAAAAQMAQVSLVDANSYRLTIDSDGDGVLNAPQTFTLPANASLQFDVPYPRTIYFNWRGRTVDAAGVVATPAFIAISSTNNYGTSRIDLTSSGQPSLDGPPASTAVTNSAPPAATFRSNTQIP